MQPASTFPATDMKQFYVSVSRARHVVHIYTDDAEALFDHVKESGDRTSALELTDKMIVTRIAEDGNASTSVIHKNTTQTINSPSGAFKKHEPTPNF